VRLTDAVRRRLVRAASAARKRAYAPYSDFRVGAAVLDDRGRVVAGCNVENASYGLTCCAERTAIFKAVSEGAKRIRAVAIVLKGGTPCAPCGACRQVIFEFGPEAEVIMANAGSKGFERFPIRSLLPRAFGPKSL